ncbi:hypothetical protein LVJ94_48220 [Pendulispora rubella]|uniref:NADH:flavin oxidoreductase/NADH oxidase N-terminal domain-containing protein n=1 Tax=Pendulispora rubella TaxID=2741070 RepID=A0ABZ2L150_9BACT
MSKLFSGLNMGDLQLAHRVVVLSPRDYAAVSSLGGLVVSEPVATGDAIETWRRTTDTVHERGGLIVLRLVHPGGANPSFTATVDGAGIDSAMADYAASANKALSAGFDGIELDATSGSLPEQFLREGVNHRTDRYGGSIDNRIHFLAEVIEALANVWGTTRIGVRLSPYGSDINDPSELFTAVLSALSDQEIAYTHIVCPIPDRIAARRFRAAFSDPILVSGNYTAETALACIESRMPDAIGFDSVLPEPFAPNTARKS